MMKIKLHKGSVAVNCEKNFTFQNFYIFKCKIQNVRVQQHNQIMRWKGNGSVLINCKKYFMVDNGNMHIIKLKLELQFRNVDKK